MVAVEGFVLIEVEGDVNQQERPEELLIEENKGGLKWTETQLRIWLGMK